MWWRRSEGNIFNRTNRRNNRMSMNPKSIFKTRLYITAIVTIGIWALLAWSHYHGGVPSHHLLNNKDLPAISNWWGGLVLPILTWYLVYRIQKRTSGNTTNYSTQVIYRFIIALLFGIGLSAAFTFGDSVIPGYMMMAVFPMALLFPLYRAEYLLGFVIGMTYTFGAVLPTLIGSILVIICTVLYLYVRSAIRYIISTLRPPNQYKNY